MKSILKAFLLGISYLSATIEGYGIPSSKYSDTYGYAFKDGLHPHSCLKNPAQFLDSRGRTPVEEQRLFLKNHYNMNSFPNFLSFTITGTSTPFYAMKETPWQENSPQLYRFEPVTDPVLSCVAKIGYEPVFAHGDLGTNRLLDLLESIFSVSSDTSVEILELEKVAGLVDFKDQKSIPSFDYLNLLSKTIYRNNGLENEAFSFLSEKQATRKLVNLNILPSEKTLQDDEMIFLYARAYLNALVVSPNHPVLFAHDLIHASDLTIPPKVQKLASNFAKASIHISSYFKSQNVESAFIKAFISDVGRRLDVIGNLTMEVGSTKRPVQPIPEGLKPFEISKRLTRFTKEQRKPLEDYQTYKYELYRRYTYLIGQKENCTS